MWVKVIDVRTQPTTLVTLLERKSGLLRDLDLRVEAMIDQDPSLASRTYALLALQSLGCL